MYQALYRKWRPSFFDDVVGQEHITSILKSEVENGKLSHAYLFCGPRGTGKTTCAKIIAKAANCLSPVDGNPCGKCEACLAIDAGTTTDVIEMDAASNNGVDSIRELREGVVYTPAEMKFRVYIIDEVHMLSISAFNALLKTLEEPPKHVLFILATTELHKIPATVLSRCQRFDFHRVATDAIVGRLRTVCRGEGFTAEEGALELIARLSQGGMRDSLNMLEYCAGDGERITEEKAERLLGAASRSLLAKLTDAAACGDTASALAVIEEIHLSSRDVAVFWRELIAFARDMLIAVSTRMRSVKDELLRSCAEKYSLPRLLYTIRIWMEAEEDMQRNPSGARLYAEMSMIRACDLALSDDTEALLARITALEDQLATGNFKLPAAATATEKKEELQKELPILDIPDDQIPPEGDFVPEYPTDEPIPAAEPNGEPSPKPAVKEKNASAVKAEAKAEQPARKTEKAQTGEKAESEGNKLKGYRKWQEVVRRLAPTEGLFIPFLQSAYAYEGTDGKFYIFFESKFGITLLNDARKQTICAAVNAAGALRAYIPADVIGTFHDDVGGIREPIEDLLELEETEVTS
ncbi:MAG: DNA polymerase III subunit gamma/tau [Clostridia bacterium]|nr:DNA polymerase III subunit gamma/tau [Clostridia bacterium]